MIPESYTSDSPGREAGRRGRETGLSETGAKSCRLNKTAICCGGR
jgi:hypothetical protein